MLEIAPIEQGWHLTARSHRALWEHLANGGGSDLTTLLAELDCTGCFWECAPVCASHAEGPFECVVLPTTAFERHRAEPRAFSEHFGGPGPPIRVFDNLGRDSVLVSPTPTGDFPHLLAFLRSAPQDLSNELWTRTALAVLPRLSEARPLWVSTHGLGVLWLHIRIDERPKYYHHAPFRRVPRC